MKLEMLKVLSEQEIKDIHEASLDILANCGVKILSHSTFDFLKEKGLEADEQTKIVRFSRQCIEDTLSTIPPEFEVFDREGKFAFVLGDRVPKVAAGHNAVFWVDSKTGERRNSTVADVELFARICEQLECIDLVGIPVMPQDVPDRTATLLYGVKACIENSTKPIYFSTNNLEVNKACIEMIRAAFKGNFREQIYGINQLSPTSPLFWEEGALEALVDTVEAGVPLAVLPEPNAGMSSPYTLAGLLTINNAECLSGLAITQLLNPGHKVMYANSWTTTDMRSGAALVGSTETTICRIAAAQLAHFYNVPSHTTAPNSDNHAHDEQNAWEKTLSMFASVGAGHDLIVNCGMFATGMTYSNEQLLMDEEISAMCKRIATGVSVNKDTMAVDLIKQIGPQGGNYLIADHTVKWLYSDEYVKPRLSVSGAFALWEQNGAKDTYQLAREKIDEYAEYEPPQLPADMAARLDEIISSF